MAGTDKRESCKARVYCGAVTRYDVEFECPSFTEDAAAFVDFTIEKSRELFRADPAACEVDWLRGAGEGLVAYWTRQLLGMRDADGPGC